MVVVLTVATRPENRSFSKARAVHLQFALRKVTAAVTQLLAVSSGTEECSRALSPSLATPCPPHPLDGSLGKTH